MHQELLVEFSCDPHLISALRFIACVTIGLLTSDCHNRNNLSFSLYAVLSICYVVTTLDEWIKSEIRVSTDWYVAVEH